MKNILLVLVVFLIGFSFSSCDEDDIVDLLPSFKVSVNEIENEPDLKQAFLNIKIKKNIKGASGFGVNGVQNKKVSFFYTSRLTSEGVDVIDQCFGIFSALRGAKKTCAQLGGVWAPAGKGSPCRMPASEEQVQSDESEEDVEQDQAASSEDNDSSNGNSEQTQTNDSQAHQEEKTVVIVTL